MGEVYEGGAMAAGRRFAVVASRFNELIVKQLVDGAVGTLKAAGAERVDVVWCPGAVELPFVCRRVAASGRYDSVVAVGCVIRGGTPHFEYVSSVAANGILRASLDTDVPIHFGVLTTDTIEQAIARAGTKLGNKGAEAAHAAIETADLLAGLPGRG